VVILPQASGVPDRGTRSVEPWRAAGAKAVILLDPLTEGSRAELERADVIWLPGGSQSRLVRELKAAGLLDVLRARHAEGAVVAGTSAGAAVMSRVMLTGRADLESVTAGATEVADGFGLWPRVIVDQHFVARRRNNRLISAVLDRPELVGVGIDEDTGVVVSGGRFEAIGEGTVIVYDAREAKVEEHTAGKRHGATNLRVHVLRAGMTAECP
jgi:cyanophycinase